ncbi:MAG TPA: hypothetical protein VFE45_00650, partial [Coriobacteriia bacterium]|nr:hypothetical protein [Coriobacteriia bacterium]
MRRRLVPLLVVAAVVLSGAPGAVAGEAESTVEGEVQRFSIEMLDGSAVELTVVVPEDGEPVRVRNEDLEDVGTGAIAEVVVAEVSEESQEVTDPEGGAVALDVAVLDETEAQAAEEPILAEAQGTVRMAHMVLGRIGSQSADSVTLSTLATDITHDVGPYWSDSTGGQLAFGLGSQTSAGSYGGWGSTSTCTTSQILGALDWSATIAGVAPTYNQGRHSVLYTPR